MAGERTLPGISLTGYWNSGDNTWKAGMDENLRKLSVLVQLRVLSRVTPLPFDDSNSSGVANGDIYIMPASDSNSFQSSNSSPLHGDIAVFDDGAWVFFTPLAGFRAYVIDESTYYRYTGSAWVADGGNATAVSYDAGDTGDSNSTATTVAAALDDLYARIRAVSAGAVDATTVSYNSTADSNSADTTVQEALDTVFHGLINHEDRIATLEAASGTTFSSLIVADFTITAADDKKVFKIGESSNSPASIFARIPEDALEDLPDGFTCSFVQIASSQLEITVAEDSNSPGSLTLIYPSDMLAKTRVQGSVISILKTDDANTWVIFGDMEPV